MACDILRHEVAPIQKPIDHLFVARLEQSNLPNHWMIDDTNVGFSTDMGFLQGYNPVLLELKMISISPTNF